MHEVYFLFEVEVPPESNPSGTLARLCEDLRGWLNAHGLTYSLGALGGGLRCYGDVGIEPNATEADRQALAAWLSQQKMFATVRLGPLAWPFSIADLTIPITEWVFCVDNLSEAEKTEAVTAYDERRWKALSRKK